MTRFALLLSLFCLVGCSGFSIEPPQDFVELEEPEWSSYAFRSTSARGVVIGVKEVENTNAATLTFWLEAVKERLRTVRGYALLEEDEQRAASGQAGRLLRFGRQEGSQPYVYWLGLWVTPAKVYLLEAGGRRDEFEKVQGQVEQTIAGFEIGAL